MTSVTGRVLRTRLSYAKVAEHQRRGLVHFHGAIRLDGPEGPGDPSPVGITAVVLREAIATRQTRRLIHL